MAIDVVGHNHPDHEYDQRHYGDAARNERRRRAMRRARKKPVVVVASVQRARLFAARGIAEDVLAPGI
jgi:hypothetical protein